MGELLDQFIIALTHALQNDLVKGVREKADGSLAERIAQTLLVQQLRQLAEAFLNPGVAQTFLFAVVVAVLLVGISFAVHLAIERRHGRVFISFQHERESVADTLASEMASSGIAAVKPSICRKPRP